MSILKIQFNLLNQVRNVFVQLEASAEPSPSLPYSWPYSGPQSYAKLVKNGHHYLR